MKIKYLFHSGVSVEIGGDIFIFDYYMKGFKPETLIDYRNVYVFVSHAHRDHFDKNILKWSKIRTDINYIFSSDIIPGVKIKNSIFMKPGETAFLGSIRITALESTDEGIAFYIESGQGNIFHSGDLNWWHWEGESEEYNRIMAWKFKREIDKLHGETIDVAFIPIDKRLEGSMYYSIDYLMSAADVKMVCPIHFWDDMEFLNKVKEELQNREYYNKISFYED